MQVALLASYKKDSALLELGELLKKHSWNLLASAGTAQFLNENGIACRDVAEIVGPPILGHRVVTLAREIYAALLATPADFSELEKSGITPIDLAYVTLYPLEEAIAAPDSTPENVIEKTDIGGPTLLRAAAKGRRITLSDANQIPELASFLENGSPDSARTALITNFAAKAERRVAEYVAASASYWEARA